MAGYTPDISQMRQQYTDVLAEQQKKALRGVQDIYAQRGITGGGEESLAFGEGQRQFGLGAGQAEAGLQQYFGNLGQQQAQMGEQQRQFDIGQGNWGQQFGEQQRQFDVGQGNWGQQFGLAQKGQQFGQDISLANLYSQGMLGANPFAGQTSPFSSLLSAQQQYQATPEYQTTQKIGMSPFEFSLFESMGANPYQQLFGQLPITSRPYRGGFVGGK